MRGDEQSEPVKIPLRDAGAISIGIELVVSVIIGLVAGAWADRRLATAPWLTLLGIMIGSAAGFRSLLAFSKRAQARAEREDREESKSNESTPTTKSSDESQEP